MMTCMTGKYKPHSSELGSRFFTIVCYIKHCELHQLLVSYQNVYFAQHETLLEQSVHRVKASGMKVIRPDAAVARYQMIRAHHHTTDKENPAK